MSNKPCAQCEDIFKAICIADWQFDLVHHRSLVTLHESAQKACGICTVLLEHLQSRIFQEVPDLWDNVFPIICESDTSLTEWQSSFDLTLTSAGVENLSLKFTLESIAELEGQ